MPWSNFFVLQELDAQIEQLHEELGLAHTLSDGENAHLDAKSARARRQAKLIEEGLELREARRAETAKGLPDRFLAHYERLRSHGKMRPWVVRLMTSHCPACNLLLPSKLVGDMRQSQEPAACPSCQRLLVWRDPVFQEDGERGSGKER